MDIHGKSYDNKRGGGKRERERERKMAIFLPANIAYVDDN